MVIIATLVDV